ncbi:phage tail tape measure protein [Brevibacillus ruminantium]|uniref:Phage tail tape measure protein n=1 Tax=Brevibacillus ruminantium TaxID=2950604 RepID=A0ABY4WNN3_9BACL|nr:phage tail tape measure protein [Brevibacillus ruminantium]USG67450.1 phage tail tape measure protein [Brevibacillus ruminantium]
MAKDENKVSVSIQANLTKSFEKSFDKAIAYVKRLEVHVKDLSKRFKDFNNEVQNGGKPLQAHQNAQQQLQAQMEKTNKVQKSAAERQKALQDQASQLRGHIAAVKGPFLAAGQAALQFEGAMIGVAAQTKGARDEQGKLTPVYDQMRKGIQMLGRELPVATNELAGMVRAGLGMNVPHDQVIAFTRDTVKMATVFGSAPEQMTAQMAKLSEVMALPADKLNDLGDTLLHLGAASGVNGAKIANVLTSIGGAASQVKLTEHQAAALASTFLSLGKSESEASAAAGTLLQVMASAQKQPEAFQTALQQLGLTAEQVHKGMAEDAQGTILKMLDGLGKLDEAQQTGVATALFGQDSADEITELASAAQQYREQLALLNDEQRKGGLDRSFSAQMESASYQLLLMKNSVTEASVALGTTLLPVISQVASGVSTAAQTVSAFAEKYPNLTQALVVGAATAAGLSAAWSGVKLAWTQAQLISNGLNLALGRQTAVQTTAAGATTRLTIAQRLLNVAMRMNPIGMVITAIGVLVGAGVYLYNNWEAVKNMVSQVWQTLQNNPILGLVAGPIGSLIAAGLTLYNNWDMLKQGASDLCVKVSNWFREMVNSNIRDINKFISMINQRLGTSFPLLQELKMDLSVYLRKMQEKKLARNLDMDGSHANGLSYVPFDGYIAELHKGERVLTAEENRTYSDGSFWKQAGDGLGKSTGGNVIHLSYAPVIHGAHPDSFSSILQEDKKNLLDYLKSIEHQGRRVSFSV